MLLFGLFFDYKDLDMTIEETNRYAQPPNSNFVLDNTMLQRFLGIWYCLDITLCVGSNNPTLSVAAVKLCKKSVLGH